MMKVRAAPSFPFRPGPVFHTWICAFLFSIARRRGSAIVIVAEPLPIESIELHAMRGSTCLPEKSITPTSKPVGSIDPEYSRWMVNVGTFAEVEDDTAVISNGAFNE